MDIIRMKSTVSGRAGLVPSRSRSMEFRIMELKRCYYKGVNVEAMVWIWGGVSARGILYITITSHYNLVIDEHLVGLCCGQSVSRRGMEV
eukprot:c14826_g1_i1 orf=500-769(+)